MTRPSDAEIVQNYRDLKRAEEDLLAEWQQCQALQAVIRFSDSRGGSDPIPAPDPNVIGYRAPAGMAGRDDPDPCADLKRRYDEARRKSHNAFPGYSDAVERTEAARDRESSTSDEPPESGLDEFGNPIPDRDPNVPRFSDEVDEIFRKAVRVAVAKDTPEEMQNRQRNAARKLTEAEAKGDPNEVIAQRKHKKWVDEAIAAELDKRGLSE